MKTFIIKTSIFTSLSIAAIVALFYATNYYLKENACFKIDKSCSYIIVGHSHSESAYNDSLIKCTDNLSMGGESYFWTCSKVKQVVNQNPQIKTVFIEFSNNQIEESIQSWIWGNKHISERLYTYIPFLEKEDINLLYTKNQKGFVTASSKALRRNLTRVLTANLNYSKKVGRYLWLGESITDSLVANIDYNELKPQKPLIADCNLDYLQKTINFCKEKDIQVYLIRSPQHKLLTCRRNEETFQEIRKTFFGDVEFLDFNDYPILNEEFADFGHLNYKGAKVYSEYINTLFSNNFLEADNKEFIISKSMETEYNKMQLRNPSGTISTRAIKVF